MFLSKVLEHTDIFMIWSVALMVIGFMIVDGLPRGKAIFGVLTVVVLILCAQAGVFTIISGLGSSLTSSGF